MRTILPWVGSECPRRGRPIVLELFYTGLLVLVFLFIGWFSVYVVYKLYEGQR
jgi:hypothetical protein